MLQAWCSLVQPGIVTHLQSFAIGLGVQPSELSLADLSQQIRRKEKIQVKPRDCAGPYRRRYESLNRSLWCSPNASNCGENERRESNSLLSHCLPFDFFGIRVSRLISWLIRTNLTTQVHPSHKPLPRSSSSSSSAECRHPRPRLHRHQVMQAQQQQQQHRRLRQLCPHQSRLQMLLPLNQDRLPTRPDRSRAPRPRQPQEPQNHRLPSPRARSQSRHCQRTTRRRARARREAHLRQLLRWPQTRTNRNANGQRDDRRVRLDRANIGEGA